MEPLPDNSQNSTKPVKVRKNQNRIGVRDPLFTDLKLLSNEQGRPMNHIIDKGIGRIFQHQ